MHVVFFLICLIASSIGAIVGAGGGIIIKPVMDMFGLLPVSTASFLCGVTVMAMSVSSLIRSRNNGVKLRLRTTFPLAIGAALGGLVGKWLFQLLRTSFPNENMLGMVQAICLTLITFGVFLYVCNKEKLPSKQIDSPLTSIIIGCLLGVISAFLGIGGGTSNIAVLFFFFSMDAKEAAKNSLFIIVISQLSSIATAIVTATVPAFSWLDMLSMVAGGIGGALVGAVITAHIDNRKVELVLKTLLLAMICVNFSNVIRFAF